MNLAQMIIAANVALVVVIYGSMLLPTSVPRWTIYVSWALVWLTVFLGCLGYEIRKFERTGRREE